MNTARAARLERRHLIAAALALLALGAAGYMAFVKQLPFTTRHEIHAVFATGNQIKPGDPVRVAGLQVGKVTHLAAGPVHSTVVTIDLDSDAMLHTDAHLTITPRLAFEGNFMIAVEPGSPGAPRLRDGATIPMTQTSVPVQIDQLLDTFTRPTRTQLIQSAGDLAEGLSGTPRSGAQNLQRAARELATASASVAVVAQAAQGTAAGDPVHAVRGTGDLTRQLAADPAALADSVTSFNRVFGALADKDRALAGTLRGLDGVMRAGPPALRALDAALPSVTRTATQLRPVLKVAPAALVDADGAVRQIGGLTRDAELPRLLRALAPVSAHLPGALRQLRGTLPGVKDVTDCVGSVVVPTLNKTIDDGPNSSGRPVWQDLVHFGATLAGASPNFDGNGTTIRLGLTQGEVSMQLPIPGFGTLTGGKQIEGVNPTWLGSGVDPPYRPDANCAAQQVPDLGARAGGPPADFSPAPTARTSKTDAQAPRLLARIIGAAGQVRDALINQLARLLSPAPKGATTPPRSRPALPAPVLHPHLTPPRPTSTPARPEHPVVALPKPGQVVEPVLTIVKKLLGQGR